MDRMKNAPDYVMSPGHKSWVASRFILIKEAGISKRRCKHLDCTKEYARGTSHMILKRHWSKQHGTNDEDLPIASMKSKNHDLNDLMSSGDSHKVNRKSPLKYNNSGAPVGAIRTKAGQQNVGPGTTDKKPTIDKTQLDAKLIARRLKEATSLHLTFDVHTVKKGGRSFGIISAHSLNEYLETRTVLLEYKHLPYPNDPGVVSDFLRTCILKFNIREKIISITSNCSHHIASAIQDIEKRFRLSRNFNFSTIHIQCFPQFIHINIMEVLRSQENLIESVRKSVCYINNNNVVLHPILQEPGPDQTQVMSRPEHLSNNNNTCNLGQSDQPLGATGLKLPYDNRSSSWSTTYNMIDTFLKQRGLIEPTLLYLNHSQDLTNAIIDWEKLYALKTLLKPFHQAIEHFSTTNCAPISLVSALLPRFINYLANTSWIYEDISIIAHNFKSNLESYYGDFYNDLTIIASFLDPRIKETFSPPDSQKSVIDIVRKRVEITPIIQKEPVVPLLQNCTEDSIFYGVFKEDDPDEIVEYLNMCRQHRQTDIPGFWRLHKDQYPALYTLNRMLGCIQATSVPGDRMFSAGENLDREKKTHESSNSKVLMRSWAKYLQK